MARTPITPHPIRIYVTDPDGAQHQLGGELIVRPALEGVAVELAIMYPPVTIEIPLGACTAISDALLDVIDRD